MRTNYLRVLLAMVLMLFVGRMSAQTITINYEQVGDGKPQMEYVSNSWTQTFDDLVAGENVITDIRYSTKNVNGEWKQAYEVLIHTNAVKELLKVEVDGVENEQYLNDGKAGTFRMYFLEQKNYTVSLKLTYSDEGGVVEDPFTHNLVGSFEGDGTVRAAYTDVFGEAQDVALNNGDNKLNVADRDGIYSIRITPVPGEGQMLKYIFCEGFEEDALMAEYNENGYVDLAFTGKDLTASLVVKFKAIPRADVILNYSQEGEGSADYYYYSADNENEKVEGTIAAGENLFDNMYFHNSKNYRLFVIPKPAEGYVLDKIILDGVENTLYKSSYDLDGYFYLEPREEGMTYDLKLVYVLEEPQEPEGHKVVIKANGDVEYVIKYSNIEEQKQEYFLVSGEDVTVYLPDNAFCSWDYTFSQNFTVRGLLINGEPLEEQTFSVTSDLEISLDYVQTEYFELEYEKPENGEIIVEYKEYDIEVYDYVYVPYEAGLPLVTGTTYRVTYIADGDSYIASVKICGEEVASSTIEDPMYEFVYEGEVWGPVTIEAEILEENSVNGVSAEPVSMTVYGIDGRIVRTCMAASAQEAVAGLEDGLYIVNGEKVLVRK